MSDNLPDDARYEIRSEEAAFVLITVPVRRLWSKDHADLKLKASSFVVYAALIERSNKQTGRCFPSIGTIADDCNLNESTVVSAIKDLKRVGLIRVEKERSPLGYDRSIYIIIRQADVKIPDPHVKNPNEPMGKIQTTPYEKSTSNKESTNKESVEQDTAGAVFQPTIIDVPSENVKKPLTGRARGYALAGVYLRENGISRQSITEKDWQAAATTFAALPDMYTENDVIGCIQYMLSQTWWQEPGRMQPHQVVKTLPKWIQKRPQIPYDQVQKANQTVKTDGDYWRNVGREFRSMQERMRGGD